MSTAKADSTSCNKLTIHQVLVLAVAKFLLGSGLLGEGKRARLMQREGRSGEGVTRRTEDGLVVIERATHLCGSHLNCWKVNLVLLLTKESCCK